MNLSFRSLWLGIWTALFAWPIGEALQKYGWGINKEGLVIVLGMWFLGSLLIFAIAKWDC